jgi:hypothetical protein
MQVSSLFSDYAKFHRIQIANRDVDPVYPVLKRIGDLRGWGIEERVRSVFLHVAYYDLGSALASLDQQYAPFLRAFTEPRPGLKCGTERRRHRMGDNLRVHLTDLHRIAEMTQGLSHWVEQSMTGDPVANWNRLNRNLQIVAGNGRWAAFKTCEMLAEVCGMPLRAPDMGHANSSGPRLGLGLLYPEARMKGNRAEVLQRLNELSAELVTALRKSGAEVSLETAETTLCDFHSMVEGRYYPGLDIDVMQEQLALAPLSPEMRDVAYRARDDVLPEAYLGEVRGWEGPDAKRKRVYRVTGEIATRE